MTHRDQRSDQNAMPDDDFLDEMSQKITGCDFDRIASPEHKAIIMDLAIKANQSCDMRDIAHWFRLSKLWDGL